jgi:lipopolysaccharide transport system permease protein
MVVFTIFLGNFAKLPSDGIPYPVFSYLGILPWTYFASALTRSATSLVASANLLTKVYFPRLLIPLSATLSALVDFAIAFLVLILLMAWYKITPGWSALLLIPLVFMTSLIASGAGMWLSALNVQYRDVQYTVPFLIQLWMFATPVVYPASIVPKQWRFLVALNPMAGIIEAHRSATLGRPLDWPALGIAMAVALVLCVIGVLRFRQMERIFADVV